MSHDETKYRSMTESLRMLYSDEDVAGYIKWIIAMDRKTLVKSLREINKQSVVSISKTRAMIDDMIKSYDL